MPPPESNSENDFTNYGRNNHSLEVRRDPLKQTIIELKNAKTNGYNSPMR